MSKKLPSVLMRAGEDRRVSYGHPWAFSNEIFMEAATKALEPGSLAVLRAPGGEPLGVATFNPHSLIAARVLDRDAGASIDAAWFARRFEAARALRDRLYGKPFYRLVHAEADGLPGLIVDRYGDTLSVQVNTAGMERLTPQILEALDAVLAPRTVALKNDSPVRTLEGLERSVSLAKGEASGLLELEENGARFVCDPVGGQKTGWFYDQRDNRALVAGLSEGRRVLDAYCYAGGFGVLAALRGAGAVTMVDSSAPALDLAREAAKRNGVEAKCAFSKEDAFDALARLATEKTTFDVAVVDPPAFVKSRKDLKAGAQGYRKLARLAAPVVAPGGLLFIASCSHLMDPPAFAEQVRRGLFDAGRPARILKSVGAGADHPVHPALPESAYLKGELLQLD